MRNSCFTEEMDSVSSSTSSEFPEAYTDSTYIGTSDPGSERSSDDSVGSTSHKGGEQPSSSATSSPRRRKGSTIPNLLEDYNPDTSQEWVSLQQQGPSIPLHSKCFKSVITKSSPSPPDLEEAKGGNSLKRAFSCQDEPSGTSFSQVCRNVPDDETRTDRAKRFKRTADALKKCGLWEVALRSGDLMRRNQELQTEINCLKRDTANFIHSVLQNAENKEIREQFSSGLLENVEDMESVDEAHVVCSPDQVDPKNTDFEQGKAPSVVTSGYLSGSDTVSSHSAHC